VFTGIVREVGRVVRVEGDDEGLTLQVEAPRTAAGLAVGDSVSVAGVCLTAEDVADGTIRFHAVPETLARTTLARLGPGDLSGNYAGAQGSATIGVGLGGNVLVGGSANSIALQPLSLQGQVGLNVAAGLESLELRPGR